MNSFTDMDIAENTRRIMSDTPGMSEDTARKVAVIRLTATANHPDDVDAAGHEFATTMQAATRAGEAWAIEATAAICGWGERRAAAASLVIVVCDDEPDDDRVHAPGFGAYSVPLYYPN